MAEETGDRCGGPVPDGDHAPPGTASGTQPEGGKYSTFPLSSSSSVTAYPSFSG